VRRILVAAAAALALTALLREAGPALATDAVLVGAGDIASCSNNNDEATAQLLDAIDGTVFTLGDNAYETGTATQFANCYDPTWGRHNSRTMPSPGNHDYYTSGAAGYYGYFGAAAGDPTKGYYSYDLGAWHIVVINSNDACTIISCAAGSAQEQWLRADLAANRRTCTLAYWHHPRFSSSGVHGSQAYMQPVWQALYDYGADVVLSGHVHNYERFAKQTPAGAADPVRGIREFVAGTGGRELYGFNSPIANSEVRNSDTFGVLKLSLHASSYEWEFVPVAGGSFTDSGSETCFAGPSAVGGETELPVVGTSTGSGSSRLLSAALIPMLFVVGWLAMRVSSRSS
jgi:hypothetical protein